MSTFAVSLAAVVLAAVVGVTAVAATNDTQPSTGQTAATPTAHARVAPAVRSYVDAVNVQSLDALVQAFTADAVITDVTRQIAGQDDIRSWADREVIGGSLQVLEVVEDRPDGQLLLVHWAPTGSDGWRAHYDFTMSDGRLSAADLQYA
jgi:ketosteroid isomerase-like protein